MAVDVSAAEHVDDELVRAFADLIPQLSSSSPPPSAEDLSAIVESADSVLYVARVDGRIAGHILFSPVTAVPGVTGVGLGPMAVTPEQQRRGIGAALIDAGLARLRAVGCPFVVVLGHHEYYTRFGFVPASRHGLRCEWDVPDESFMVHVLDAGATAAAAGLIRYRPEFLMEMPG